MNSTDNALAPIRVALKDDNSGGGRSMVFCPACRAECVHVDGVKEDPGSSVRGSRVVISFWGECGHNFDLTFVTHKGYTFGHIDNAHEPKEVPVRLVWE